MKSLCVDFDGVLHSYVSGWKGADVIPDPPVQGAIEFLVKAVNKFDVHIFSTRSNQEGGIRAMKSWLIINDLPRPLVEDGVLKFPTTKPLAWVSIDDRAMQFNGSFPTIQEIDSFQPWTKFLGVHDVPVSEHHRHAMDVCLLLQTRGVAVSERMSILSNAMTLSANGYEGEKEDCQGERQASQYQFGGTKSGVKHDQGKSPVRRGLLEQFPRACMAVAQLSKFGAGKYTWNGWENVPNGIDRYGDAGIRHVCEAAINGPIDDESKMHHAVHEAWDALARLELVLRESEKRLSAA